MSCFPWMAAGCVPLVPGVVSGVVPGVGPGLVVVAAVVAVVAVAVAVAETVVVAEAAAADLQQFRDSQSRELGAAEHD